MLPITESSVQRSNASGTGTSVFPSARMMRYSRSTACADARSAPCGLRRSTYRPDCATSRYVGLLWPSENFVISRKPLNPGKWAPSHVFKGSSGNELLGSSVDTDLHPLQASLTFHGVGQKIDRPVG